MSERPFIASVSVLEKFDNEQVRTGCELRWFFEDGVGGKRPPQTTGAREGEIGHAHLAKYLLKGERPLRAKLAKAVNAAIDKGELPAPYRGGDDDFHVELRFDGQPKHNCDTGRWQTIDLAETLHLGGVPWEGFIDLTFRRDAVPSVIDHKFSSDIRANAKTREQLIKTVQLPVYVLSQLPYWPDAQRWEIAHHYVSRKGIDSFFVRSVVHLDQVLERKEQIERLVKRLLSVRKSTDTNDFKPNLRACDAYGGCPHQSRCPAFRGERRVALTAEEEALFDTVADVVVDPEPAAAPPPPPPAATSEEKPQRRMLIVDDPAPTAPVVDSATCACGATVTAENGSKRDGIWRHIGCQLNAVATPPDQPASKPELASEQPKPEAPPAAPKPRKNTKATETKPVEQKAEPTPAVTVAQPILPSPETVAAVGRMPSEARVALAQIFLNLSVLIRTVD